MNIRILHRFLLMIALWGGLQGTGGPLVQAQTGRGSADFLIVEKPHHLLIYNRFQQIIPEDERRKRFPSFQPFLIEQADGYLSDGFTPCFQVRIGREVFYVIKNEEGALENTAPPGEVAVLENCHLLGDTVEVLRSNELVISPGAQYRNNSATPRIYLEAGEQIIRWFRHRNHTFVQGPGAPPLFGWSNITETQRGQLWRPVAPARPALSAPTPVTLPEIAERVEREIADFNRIVAQLFAYFNEKSGQNKPVPRWQLVLQGNEIHCTLENPIREAERPVNPFTESTRYLLIRLENMLQGTEYSMTSTSGGFTIRKR